MNVDAALAVWAERLHRRAGSQQHGRPVAGGIGFGNRSADGAQVAYLRIGNSGGAIVENGNSCRVGRSGDLGVARHRAEAKRAVAANVGSFRNEVEIDQMARRGETKLHQRNEALPAGQKLGVVA